jgi:nicotinate phosphoribosyltransferase
MSVWVNDDNAALLTDLYELTMLQAYVEEGMDQVAVFDLFSRRLPAQRNYLLACGLEDCLSYLEKLHFGEEALDYLQRLGQFKPAFLDYLKSFRFTGDVHAVQEGTPVFAGEPIIEVVAPLPEAQLVETFLLNQVHFQTLAASKASRVVHAAAGRTVVDFGLRRIHAADAGIKAARAQYIAGVAATSNVLAGHLYGLPVSGTMAHSFILAHEDEYHAFEAFASVFPATVLLVDTYDTLEGVDQVIRLAESLGDAFRVRAIRLDSGDLAALAKAARKRLDDAGLERVEIFASSDLDEYAIADLLAQGAPIGGFGVGTRMGVSADAPYMDSAYKLVAYAGKGRMKLSTAKRTLPGRKQVHRLEDGGRARGDVIALHDEEVPGGRPLLQPVMASGRRLPAGQVDIRQARSRAAAELGRLPPRLLGLEPADPPYPVRVSPRLEIAVQRLERTLPHGR